MPADIVVSSIGDYQIGELNRLKSWLYHQRVKARMERDRAGRRQEKEEAQDGLKKNWLRNEISG